jgi:PAS domain S-box-containing protein
MAIPDRSSRGLSLAGRVASLLVLLSVIAALVAAQVLGWTWARQPFLGMLLEPTLVLSPIRGTGWARLLLDPPLEQPDRLIAIDDRPVEEYGDVAELVNRREVGDAVRVTVSRPDGSTREEWITLAAYSLRDVVFVFLVPFAVGVAYLGLGVWVRRVQGRGKPGQVFAAFCAAIALALCCLFDLNTTHRLAVVWSVAVPLAAGAAMHLALIFPWRHGFVRRFPVVRLLPYIPAAYLAARSAAVVYDTSQPWEYINRWRDSYLFVAVGVFFMLGMLIYRLVRPPSPIVRQQSRVILLGTTLAFLPIVPWMLLNVLGQAVPFAPAVYTPFMILFPLSIAYAILRYRLLDVDRLLSQGVAYGGLTILVVLAYSGLINALSTVVAVRATDPAVLYFFVLAMTLVFNPLRARLQRVVDRLFFREPVDYAASLQDFSRGLTQTLDLEQVLLEVGRQIENALHPACQWACLYDEASGCYTAQSVGREQEGGLAATFVHDGALARWLRQHQECLYLPPAGEPPIAFGEEWLHMRLLGAVVYTPLHSRQGLTGWLALGGKRSGEPYNSEDMAFLGALADQSTLGIENARLFAHVRRNLAAITEMKNLMDDVFSSIASGVITTDTHDQVTLFNRAAESITGLPAAQAVGRPCQSFCPPFGPLLHPLVSLVRQREAPLIGHEAQPHLPDRGQVWLRMHLSPLKDSRDVTSGVAIVVDDLTKQRELEALVRTVRETFERYVAPTVVETLLSNPESVRLGGIRQEITSLYADIRGFTAFSEKESPETQVEVLNRHLELASKAILAQEGTLDKFVGDAAMAIFNAPVEQEDHTLRAVLAAIGVQDAIHGGHADMDERQRLYFGIGIAVGEAVVGNIGSAAHQQNFTAIGDCANLSARLSDIAAPGQILISAEAYKRVQDQVRARQVGHSQPDEVYEVLGLK